MWQTDQHNAADFILTWPVRRDSVGVHSGRVPHRNRRRSRTRDPCRFLHQPEECMHELGFSPSHDIPERSQGAGKDDKP